MFGLSPYKMAVEGLIWSLAVIEQSRSVIEIPYKDYVQYRVLVSLKNYIIYRWYMVPPICIYTATHASCSIRLLDIEPIA